MSCTKASLHGYSSVGNIRSDSEGKFDNVEVTVTVIVMTQFYEHVSNSDWLQMEGGNTRRIARSHFGCCCLHKET
jgi:hypothetical protein